MLIEYCHPSPKAGIQEHQSREVAAALIAAGFAREVPLTDEKRKALRFGTSSLSGHSVQAPYVAEPTWSVIRHKESKNILVVRKSGFETTYFNGVPELKRWSDLRPERARELAEQFERMVEENKALARANFIERHRG
jgi:hypothetical protein